MPIFNAVPVETRARFAVDSPDPVAQCGAALIFLLTAVTGVFVLLDGGGPTLLLAAMLLAAMVCPRLRNTLVVTDRRVIVSKTVFGRVYWSAHAAAIGKVSYSGTPHPSGVIVELAGHAVHIGSRKNAHAIHEALNAL